MIRHLALLAAGLVAFGIFLTVGDLEHLSDPGRLDLVPLVLSGLIAVPISALATYRWRMLVHSVGGGGPASWFDYYYCFIIVRVLSLVLPKEVVELGGRTLWLRRRTGLSIAHASLSSVLDRAFDLVILPPLLLAILPFWAGYASPAQSFLLMALATVLLGCILPLCFSRFLRWVRWVLDRGSRLLVRTRLAREARIRPVDLPRIAVSTVIWAYVLTLAKYLLVISQMALLSSGFSLPIPPQLFFLGGPIGQLAFLFALTPGSIGIFEAGWFAVLRMGGVSRASAGALVVAIRFLQIVAMGLLALTVQLVQLIRRAHKPHL